MDVLDAAEVDGEGEVMCLWGDSQVGGGGGLTVHWKQKQNQVKVNRAKKKPKGLKQRYPARN